MKTKGTTETRGARGLLLESFRALVLCGALFLLLPAGCAKEPQELTPATLMLDWVPNTNHTGIYVALEQGLYAEEGIELEVIQPGESGTPVQVVAAGQVDFAISYQEEMTYARAEGIPAVSIAAVIQHNTSGFGSPQAKGLTRPKDFEGQRYGAWGSPMEEAVLGALMACDGGDVSKVAFVNVGWADYFVVTERDVDFAWIFYGWTGIEAELRGAPLNIVMLNDWSHCVPDYYTPVIVTSESAIAEQPDLVRRFMRATQRGYAYAVDHPAEAAEMLIKHAPESDPELVRRSQAWLSAQYQADATRWGEQKPEIWQGYADWMFGQGLLSRNIDATTAYTNEFLAE